MKKMSSVFGRLLTSNPRALGAFGFATRPSWLALGSCLARGRQFPELLSEKSPLCPVLRPQISAFRAVSGDAKSSGSLADSVMSAKVAAESDKAGKNDDGGAGSEDKPKGPKPLTKWQKIGYWAFGILMGGSLVANAILFSLPDRDGEGKTVKDEYSDLPFPSQHYHRLKNKIFKTKKEMEDPFSDKLLPDELQEPFYQPKYTVLIELTGLLVHSNWTHKHGWRFQKRPGLDMFLSQVGYPNFELIVYTTENPMTFHPIIDGLDPQNQFIVYRLYRPATRYIDGHHKKDLSVLNRDLKRVIVIDWNENSVDLNRDNALVLPKWEGDNSDRNLIGLAQLLQTIRESEVDDVREVLQYYKQFENPIETFRENQRKLQEEMTALEEKRKQEVKPQGVSRFASFSALARR